MRQRNTTGYAWTFMGDPPVQVLPGEEHDHDVLLDGWTAVDNEPEQTADEPAPKTPSRKRAAAADTDKDGGEPQ